MTYRLLHSALATLLLAAIVSIGAAPASAQRAPVMDSVTPEQVQQFLSDLGFPGSSLDEDRDIIVTMRNYSVLIFVGSVNGQYVRARFSITGSNATLQKMSDWNQSRLFSTAYIDSDGDANLETDLDLEGGVTPDRIKDLLRTFDLSLGQFIAFIGG